MDNTNRYIHVGPVHIQGSPGRPLIMLQTDTLAELRAFQSMFPSEDLNSILNRAIVDALNNRAEELAKREAIVSLEIVGEQL